MCLLTPVSDMYDRPTGVILHLKSWESTVNMQTCSCRSLWTLLHWESEASWIAQPWPFHSWCAAVRHRFWSPEVTSETLSLDQGKPLLLCSRLGFASSERCKAPSQSAHPFQSGQTFGNNQMSSFLGGTEMVRYKVFPPKNLQKMQVSRSILTQARWSKKDKN